MRRVTGDRRLKPRFEIVGELSGTLETVVLLPLRDAGRGGVLVDSPVPLTVGALHRINLVRGGVPTSAQVSVRHVRPMTMTTGERRFLIGFEFANVTPPLLELIERWIELHGEAAC